MKDGNPTSGNESAAATMSEVEFVTCDCCGLTEECTEAYIRRVRERNQGRWICGLCTEAVKDEIGRSITSEESRQIGNEEALNRHMSFCKSFRSSTCTPPSRKPTEDLISAMKQLLLRSLDSPRTPRSSPGSPMMRKDRWGTGDRRLLMFGRKAAILPWTDKCSTSFSRNLQ